MVRKNKNIIVVSEEVEIAKGVFLSEGDALIKTRQGWTLVEADAEKDDEDLDDEVVEEEEEGEGEDDDDDKEEKKENYRRRRR